MSDEQPKAKGCEVVPTLLRLQNLGLEAFAAVLATALAAALATVLAEVARAEDAALAHAVLVDTVLVDTALPHAALEVAMIARRQTLQTPAASSNSLP